MARVNVEGRALAETRFLHLKREAGLKRLETIGMLVVFWHDSQERLIISGTRKELEKFIYVQPEKIPVVFDAMVNNDYLTDNGDGTYTIRGNKRQVGYLAKKRQAASLGGKATSAAKKKSYKSTSKQHSSSTREPTEVLRFDSIRSDSIQSDSSKNKNTAERSSTSSAPPTAPHSFPPGFEDPVAQEFIVKNGIKQTAIDAWFRAYQDPAWIQLCVLNAVAWVANNPQRAPKTNYGAFIGKWLARDWERHRKSFASNPAKKSGVKFQF